MTVGEPDQHYSDQTPVEFGPPTEAELDDVFEFLRHVFEGWPGLGPEITPREHLTWKCHSTEDSMRLHSIGRLDGNVVSGIFRVERSVKVLDEVLSAQSGGDSSVLPRLQGQGVFGRMRRYNIDDARRNGVSLNFAFPGHVATARAWGSAGLVGHPKRLSVLMKPLHTMRAARRMRRAGVSLPSPLVAAGIRSVALATRLRHGSSKPPAVRGAIETIKAFDESVNALWESASRDFDFIAVRDRNYLNWRYCDPRAGDFTVRLASFEGRVEGYLVLKFLTGQAFIADIFALSGRADVVERLLLDADRVAHENGADSIVCHLPEWHPYMKALFRTGFFSTGGRVPFSAIPLAIDPAKLDFLARPDTRIHVTHGDRDTL